LPSETATRTVGLIGARGYVGREMIALLERHPILLATLAVSRELGGRRVRDELGVGPEGLRFTSPDPASLAGSCPDVLVLALPNGQAAKFLDDALAAGAAPGLVVDLSADMRADERWAYAVPEIHADRLEGATRIANPGCYATAIQIALAPLRGLGLVRAHCVGVSGYSGAGTAPSERNDTARLAGGVLPYALVAHGHEAEAARHIGVDIRFVPAVAPFFRGITLTAMVDFAGPVTADAITGVLHAAYQRSPLLRVTDCQAPRVQEVIETPFAAVGGAAVHPDDRSRAALVCVIDNLLKGAASQAIQNINLALGLPGETGLLP